MLFNMWMQEKENQKSTKMKPKERGEKYKFNQINKINPNWIKKSHLLGFFKRRN